MRSAVGTAVVWVARYWLVCLASLIVLTVLAGVVWTFVVVDDGPLVYRAAMVAAAMLVALKGLYMATELVR